MPVVVRQQARRDVRPALAEVAAGDGCRPASRPSRTPFKRKRRLIGRRTSRPEGAVADRAGFRTRPKPDPPAEAPCSPSIAGVKLTTLFTMCFALFMAMLDNTVVNVALPTIQRDFGSGVSGLQWIISAYTLFFASLMLTGGTLGDLYGRKRLFLIGLVVFTSGSLLCGLAPSLHWLIAGRAVQGVGAAALLPGTLSILITTFPDPRERAQAIGLWAGVSGLALAAGPGHRRRCWSTRWAGRACSSSTCRSASSP